jgi:Tol biopolymer transport system component
MKAAFAAFLLGAAFALTACTRVGGKNDSPNSEGVAHSKLAFVSGFTRNGASRIYVMNPDGSGRTRLTTKKGADTNPVWSPDGSRIAFLRNERLYVINSDGSGEMRLAKTSHAYTQSWSPDGREIAFLRSARIHVVSADGSGEIRRIQAPEMSAPEISVSDPAWSSDGSKIAFTAQGFPRYSHQPPLPSRIYAVNADDSELMPLTESKLNAREPAWSPDGSRIAFTSFLDGSGEIFVMSADGGDQVRLTQTEANEGNPTWSPDGSKIAFTITRASGNAVAPPRAAYVMSADGSHVSKLMDNVGDLSWSPDSSKLAVSVIHFPEVGGGHYKHRRNLRSKRRREPSEEVEQERGAGLFASLVAGRGKRRQREVGQNRQAAT